MLTDEQLIKINNILELCDAYLLTDYEVSLLNKIGEDPQTDCDYYETANQVLVRRSQTDTLVNKQITVLFTLAEIDGCEMEREPEKVPDVDIPFFGLGL